MPNWTTNEIFVSQDPENEASVQQMQAFIACSVRMKDGKKIIDFGGVMPMPKELDIGDVPGDSPDATDEELLAKSKDETLEPWERETALAQWGMRRNKRKFGYASWYDWCCRYWGTKWNACHSEVGGLDGDVFYAKFDTAWCMPRAWILSASLRYPDLTFEVVWDNEGEGFFIEAINEYQREYHHLVLVGGEVVR